MFTVLKKNVRKKIDIYTVLKINPDLNILINLTTIRNQLAQNIKLSFRDLRHFTVLHIFFRTWWGR